MNHILLVVLSASVLATVGTIFYHMVDTNYKTETAIYAQADQALSFRGVYIRDESVLTYDGDGAIRYAVNNVASSANSMITNAKDAATAFYGAALSFNAIGTGNAEADF